MSRRLSLKGETLAELTSADLAAVRGASIPTEKLTTCITQIIDPPSNTHVCSDECFA